MTKKKLKIDLSSIKYYENVDHMIDAMKYMISGMGDYQSGPNGLQRAIEKMNNWETVKELLKK